MCLILLKLFQIVKDLAALGLTSFRRGEEGIDNHLDCQQSFSCFFQTNKVGLKN